MGGPLSIHILKLLQCLDGPGDRASQFGPIGVVEKLVHMVRDDLFLVLGCAKIHVSLLFHLDRRPKSLYRRGLLTSRIPFARPCRSM